jgi:hypothetical protein
MGSLFVPSRAWAGMESRFGPPSGDWNTPIGDWKVP